MAWSAYTYGTTVIKKHNYEVYMRATATKIALTGTFTDFVTAIGTGGFEKVGACEEKPSIKSSAGQTKKINSGAEIVLSQKVDINIKDLQVDPTNFSETMALVEGNVDVLFVDHTNKRVIAVWNIKANANASFEGNSYDMVEITSSYEVGRITDVVEFAVLT